MENGLPVLCDYSFFFFFFYNNLNKNCKNKLKRKKKKDTPNTLQPEDLSKLWQVTIVKLEEQRNSCLSFLFFSFSFFSFFFLCPLFLIFLLSFCLFDCFFVTETTAIPNLLKELRWSIFLKRSSLLCSQSTIQILKVPNFLITI